MFVVVLFESLTGNTRRAAEMIGGAAKARGAEVVVRPITSFDFHELSRADLVFVGTWVDGFVVAGHRPGRAGRLRKLPVLDRKPMAAFLTYAINPGKALAKTEQVLRGRGASIVASRQFRRDRLELGMEEFVDEALRRVQERV